MLVAVDSGTATRLLRIYGINAPVPNERLIGAHDPARDIPVTVDGVAGDRGGLIRLKIAGQRFERACPLTPADAESLVGEFRATHVLTGDPKVDRTIAKLVEQCSKLYCDSGLREVHLLLFVTPEGYRTHAVYMRRAPHVPVRRGTIYGL
jgi:hypothetical protein